MITGIKDHNSHSKHKAAPTAIRIFTGNWHTKPFRIKYHKKIDAEFASIFQGLFLKFILIHRIFLECFE